MVWANRTESSLQVGWTQQMNVLPTSAVKVPGYVPTTTVSRFEVPVDWGGFSTIDVDLAHNRKCDPVFASNLLDSFGRLRFGSKSKLQTECK